MPWQEEQIESLSEALRDRNENKIVAILQTINFRDDPTNINFSLRFYHHTLVEVVAHYGNAEMMAIILETLKSQNMTVILNQFTHLIDLFKPLFADATDEAENDERLILLQLFAFLRSLSEDEIVLRCFLIPLYTEFPNMAPYLTLLEQMRLSDYWSSLRLAVSRADSKRVSEIITIMYDIVPEHLGFFYRRHDASSTQSHLAMLFQDASHHADIFSQLVEFFYIKYAGSEKFALSVWSPLLCYAPDEVVIQLMKVLDSRFDDIVTSLYMPASSFTKRGERLNMNALEHAIELEKSGRIIDEILLRVLPTTRQQLLHKKNQYNKTPLQIAVLSKNVDAVLALLRAYDREASDAFGECGRDLFRLDKNMASGIYLISALFDMYHYFLDKFLRKWPEFTAKHMDRWENFNEIRTRLLVENATFPDDCLSAAKGKFSRDLREKNFSENYLSRIMALKEFFDLSMPDVRFSVVVYFDSFLKNSSLVEKHPDLLQSFSDPDKPISLDFGTQRG